MAVNKKKSERKTLKKKKNTRTHNPENLALDKEKYQRINKKKGEEKRGDNPRARVIKGKLGDSRVWEERETQSATRDWERGLPKANLEPF